MATKVKPFLPIDYEKISCAIKDSGKTISELSVSMGKSRPYLASVIRSKGEGEYRLDASELKFLSLLLGESDETKFLFKEEQKEEGHTDVTECKAMTKKEAEDAIRILKTAIDNLNGEIANIDNRTSVMSTRTLKIMDIETQVLDDMGKSILPMVNMIDDIRSDIENIKKSIAEKDIRYFSIDKAKALLTVLFRESDEVMESVMYELAKANGIKVEDLQKARTEMNVRIITRHNDKNKILRIWAKPIS